MSAVNEQSGQPLDNLLARELTLQWAEAVALVQGTCRQLIVTRATGFPEASQIVLYREGTVVALTTAKQPPVPAAAHLLASMLGDDVPLRLRLVVSQAVADGGYATLQEFSEALAYFERPDGQTILSGLYRRAVAAPPRQNVTAVPALPMPSAAPPARHAAPAVPARRRRWAFGAAVAAGLLCLSVLLFLGARAGGAAVGVGTAAPGDHPATPSPDKRVVNHAARRAANPADVVAKPFRTPAEALPSTASFDELPMLHSRSPNAASLLPAIGRFSDWRLDVPVKQGPDFRELARTADLVYSTANADVVPPQSVYPKLRPIPPDTPRAERTVLDLLISPDGSVEHAHLRTTPRDVHEFMLVSAAKAWRFDPATVDGRPVRFLHSIAITSADLRQ